MYLIKYLAIIMLQLALLNSIAPKLRLFYYEGLDARYRNWFTDGYRAAVAGTTTCHTNTDCEVNEVCQGGFCAGLQRPTNVNGLYYGDDEREILSQPDSYATNYDYDHDQAFNDQGKQFYQPEIPKHNYMKDHEYDFDFE